ncbi:MAG: TonB family protein [Gemmatimonadaceae bacterium]
MRLRMYSLDCTVSLLAMMLIAPMANAQSSASASATIYEAKDVDVGATLMAGNSGPVYPQSLRSLGVGGKVMAQFIIDSTGMVDTTSIQTDADGKSLFAVSVREALAKMRFVPAQKAGHKVSEEVLQSFVFKAEIPLPASVDSMLTNAGAKLDGGPAAISPGSLTPRYPEKARSLGYQGEVDVQFVIDSTGAPDPKTITIVSARAWRDARAAFSKPATESISPPYDEFDAKQNFIDAVRWALPTMRFVPARRDGANVRHLVSQPFTFTLVQ